MPNAFTTTSATNPAGLHTYTLARLVAAVKHALGGTPDSKTTPEEIVNDAIQYLANLHPWSWKHSPLSLDVVAAQNYVLLPTDFVAIHTINAPGGFFPLRADTLEGIQSMRASPVGIGSAAGYWYAVNWITQTGGTLTPRARLEVYPTPAATAAAVFTGTYVRAIKLLSGDANLPDIPPAYHALLKQLVRAKAVSDEEQQQGEDWRLFNEMLPRFLQLDAGQPNLGRMRGGVARDYDDGRVVVRGTIVAP